MHSTLPRHIKADILKALVLTGMAATSTGMAATPTGMIAASTGGNTQVVAVGGWGCPISILSYTSTDLHFCQIKMSAILTIKPK